MKDFRKVVAGSGEGGSGSGTINIDIVQETGVSTTKVMSQDATTKKVLYKFYTSTCRYWWRKSWCCI